MSRRCFLAGMGAVLLAACADIEGDRNPDLGGDSSLRVLNWPGYIDAADDGNINYAGGTLSRLAEMGLTVDYNDLYFDNEEGFRLVVEDAVNTQPPAFDIVVPTNWRAAQMIGNGWATELPIEVIPNHANIDPSFLTNSWDRGCRYQMPWQAGITGIAYDPALTGRPLTSVDDLFDPEFAGRVGVIGEMREAVGLAMLANGDDPSRPTVAAAEAGLDRLAQVTADGQVGAFTFNEFADKLASGELVAAMAWSGDVALLQSDRPDIEFIIPDEGAIQWFDTMVIPAGSTNLAAAGRFMDFVYDPVNAAGITEWVQYISPVMGVQEELVSRGGAAAELATNRVLFPDDETRRRLYTWGGLPEADERTLDEAYAALIASL